jgi:hypothetical protein
LFKKLTFVDVANKLVKHGLEGDVALPRGEAKQFPYLEAKNRHDVVRLLAVFELTADELF